MGKGYQGVADQDERQIQEAIEKSLKPESNPYDLSYEPMSID